MEPDRYQHNQKFYIIGMISMIVSMTLFGLGGYIFPRVAFGLIYGVPDFIFSWVNLIHVTYNVNEDTAGWLVLITIVLLGFVFAFITYMLSSRIDNEIYGIEKQVGRVETKKTSSGPKEVAPLVLKILLIVGFVFIIAKVFQWAISTN